MSQLIQLRQRLKAIETIKKITSAMRIISRSLHTRMNKQKATVQEYQEHTKTLFEKLHQIKPNWRPNHFFPDTSKYTKKLYIIVGSQKGLCGNYNTEVNYWIGKNHTELAKNDTHIVTIGRKTVDMVTSYNLKITQQFEELKATNIAAVTLSIIASIESANPRYTQVMLICSRPESFFVHRLQEQQLIPLTTEPLVENDETYLWLHKPKLILEKLGCMYLKSQIHSSLFLSLFGEQAARFIAMDNATRNANNFTDTMKLQYNKMRQAKITRELTELAANFQE